jgi:hypothetical protein
MEPLKITACLKSSQLIANPELIKGNFGQVLRGLADEVLKTEEFRFIVVSRTVR